MQLVQLAQLQLVQHFPVLHLDESLAMLSEQRAEMHFLGHSMEMKQKYYSFVAF